MTCRTRHHRNSCLMAAGKVFYPPVEKLGRTGREFWQQIERISSIPCKVQLVQKLLLCRSRPSGSGSGECQ